MRVYPDIERIDITRGRFDILFNLEVYLDENKDV